MVYNVEDLIQPEDTGSRKPSVRKMVTAGGLVLLLALLLAFGYYQNNHLIVSDINLVNDRTGTMRIVHLSDLHSKQFGRENSRLLERILDLNPDLIVFSGDMIDDSRRNLNETVDFIDKLNRQVPVVCVAGNHELRSNMIDELRPMFLERGIVLLENEIYTLAINDSRVNILGMSVLSEGFLYEQDAAILFSQLSELQGLRVVLSHYPEHYSLAGSASYNQFDFDLMFSGHAHGGQFSLPFIGGIYAPGQGFGPKYYKGLYDDRLIVSAGLGNSVVPLRLFNYPQIIVVQIN